MISTTSRLRSVGWVVLLGLCLALVVALAFRVNALRSQIHHAEARIVALKQEKMYLETEFETRSNQQQLKAWNDVEFGYAAPNASQYLEGERQLAALSVPATPDAPAPIRVASVDDSVIASAAFPAMVSPLSGKALASNDSKAVADDGDEDRPARTVDHAEAVETLKDRLGKVVDARPRGPVRKETASDKERPAKKDKSESATSAKPKVAQKAAAKDAAAKGVVAKERAKTAKSDARPAGKPAAKSKAVATADKSGASKAKSSSAPRAAKGKEAKAAR
ncbi:MULTISPECIES: hypothetical protein [Novosphingobium]|uniref:Colicin transporter n=1 Tax=Novosphingobium subterraneum TaxID=48936 RepID=A0A0B9AAW3_9SPHN|nr:MULTISPECIES: hypothetical protein [Novosphingobium]KHS46490.1 hypothetical protein NJ75_02081 [Novosphingobium subterraneum]